MLYLILIDFLMCVHSDRCFPTLWQRPVFQLRMSRASSHGFVVWMHLFLYHWHVSIIQDTWLFEFQALQVSFMFSSSCRPHVLHISRSLCCRIFRFSGSRTYSIRAFQRCQCQLKASSGSRDIHNLASGWGLDWWVDILWCKACISFSFYLLTYVHSHNMFC